MSDQKSVRYTIPGKPKGKSRPRFGKGSVYTDDKTKDYEQLSKVLYNKAAKGVEFPQGTPVRVIITACFPIPSSANKNARQEMESGARLPMLRPDTDNIAKIILDSLNKTAYLDDAQVVETHVRKKYSTEPCVIVTVEEIEKFNISKTEYEKTISFMDAMVFILFGGKVKLKEWEEGTYIYMDKDRIVRFSGCNAPVDLESIRQRNDWIILHEIPDN